MALELPSATVISLLALTALAPACVGARSSVDDTLLLDVAATTSTSGSTSSTTTGVSTGISTGVGTGVSTGVTTGVSTGTSTGIGGATTTSTTSTTGTTGGGGTGGMGGMGVSNPVISGDNGGIQAETSVMTAPDGRVAVAWIDITNNGKSTIGYTISTDDGASFPVKTLLSSPGGRVASDPVLALGPAGDFYVTWVGYHTGNMGNPYDMHVYVAKAAAGGTTFGAPIEVSDPAITAVVYDKPWLAVTNKGQLIITYATFPTQNSMDMTLRIMSARSADGVTWQRSPVVESVNEASNLAFVCTPKNGNRIWVTYLTTTPDVRLSFSDDGGATWLPGKGNVNLGSESVAYDDPNCVAEGNDVWVSYGLSNDSPSSMDSSLDFALRLAHSTDGGKTIAGRYNAHDPKAGSAYMHAQIALEDSGAIDIVYYAGMGDQDDTASYRRAHATDPKLGFSASIAVESPLTMLKARNDPRWIGDYSGIAWRAGNLYTSYGTNVSGASHVAFAKAKP